MRSDILEIAVQGADLDRMVLGNHLVMLAALGGRHPYVRSFLAVDDVPENSQSLD